MGQTYMATALVRVEAGTAIVYSSGSLSSLVDVGGLSSIIVTRTDRTPPGDPVRVDLSSIIGQLRGNCSIIVQGGATAYVGGGLVNVGLGNSLKLDGGRLVIRSSLLNASAASSITVGPNAGELRIEQQGFGVKLDLPVNFVDAAGRPTTKIPPNFVMDFPDTQSVGAVYDPSTDRTTIGDGVSGLGIISVGRTTVLKGDPFNLRVNGKPQTDFWGNTNGYTYSFTRKNGHDDGRDGVITCFLSGSLIRTSRGAVEVEHLTIGDSVAVFGPDGEPRGWRAVTWIGQGHATVRSDLPDDEAGWPVRIRRHALAENVPQKDLLVTSEHCLLLDGHFIPARMLVNGVSILYDRGFTSYDYWHVEVAPHSIIEADGVLTESYLDTGNRRGFTFQVGRWAEEASFCWEKDAAAPLGVRRDVAEPIYQAVKARLTGPLAQRVDVEQDHVDDPSLTVVAPSGMVLPLVRQTGQRYLFRLPEACEAVSIVSRISRPCDVIGPFVDDRRRLGVLVGKVQLFREDGSRADVTAFLSASQQDGWDVQEASPCRWTNGKARLALPEQASKGEVLFLSIEILAGGPYLAQSELAEHGGVRLGNDAVSRVA